MCKLHCGPIWLPGTSSEACKTCTKPAVLSALGAACCVRPQVCINAPRPQSYSSHTFWSERNASLASAIVRFESQSLHFDSSGFWGSAARRSCKGLKRHWRGAPFLRGHKLRRQNLVFTKSACAVQGNRPRRMQRWAPRLPPTTKGPFSKGVPKRAILVLPLSLSDKKYTVVIGKTTRAQRHSAFGGNCALKNQKVHQMTSRLLGTNITRTP
jgi:hypothetical protein